MNLERKIKIQNFWIQTIRLSFVILSSKKIESPKSKLSNWRAKQFLEKNIFKEVPDADLINYLFLFISRRLSHSKIFESTKIWLENQTNLGR